MHPEKAFSFTLCWNQIHLELGHYSFVCTRFLENVGGKGEKWLVTRVTGNKFRGGDEGRGCRLQNS